jgi:hypothetical protein
LKYAVFKPEFTGNPGNPFEHADEWKKIIAYRDITDHKIALARAYQVMENYVQRQHDCILSKFKIEKVIEDNYGWKLEKHNKFLIALKDNSLIVDPEKHIYYWNSKGENGNVIDFVMQREGLSYKDAVGHLSEIYNSCNEVIEPEYVPFEQDLIDSNGQFDTPLAQVWSSYVLNELVNMINNQIDERLVNIKK